MTECFSEIYVPPVLKSYYDLELELRDISQLNINSKFELIKEKFSFDDFPMAYAETVRILIASDAKILDSLIELTIKIINNKKEFVEKSILELSSPLIIKGLYKKGIYNKKDIEYSIFKNPKRGKFIKELLIKDDTNYFVNSDILPKGSIEFILKNDLINELQVKMADPYFDINMTLEYMLIDPHIKKDFYMCLDRNMITMAAIFGSVKCFKYLALNGAELPMYLSPAIIGGNIEIISYLREHNCDIMLSFEASIAYLQFNIFNWLIENYKIEENQTKKYFEIAAKYSNFPVIFYFMKKVPKTCYEKIVTGTRIESATNYFINDLKMTKFSSESTKELSHGFYYLKLFELLAPIIQIDDDLLFYLASNGKTDILLTLQKARSFKMPKGCMAYAASERTPITEDFFELGIEVDDELNGVTALYYAALNEDLEGAKILISKGANINPDGPKPIDAAIKSRMKDMIDLLLEHGAKGRENYDFEYDDQWSEYDEEEEETEKCEEEEETEEM